MRIRFLVIQGEQIQRNLLQSIYTEHVDNSAILYTLKYNKKLESHINNSPQ